jgi:hypothetical protein
MRVYLVFFGMAAALRGAPDPAMELQKNLSEIIGEKYPGKAIVDHWHGANVPVAPLNKMVSEAIALMRSEVHPQPRRVWEIGLRLFEKLRQSNFRNELAPLLADWLREHWKRIVANETFRLSRPMQTVPAIETSLVENKKSEAFTASLLLTSAEAVGSHLSAGYEQLLKEISFGDR